MINRLLKVIANDIIKLNVQWTMDNRLVFPSSLIFVYRLYAWIKSGSNYICRMDYDTPNPQQKQNPVHKIPYD